ncbi:MAG: phytoene desaturase, partial [Calditrichae bacterium]|nr:phytoene desaturase [Calditrichia bacterium]
GRKMGDYLDLIKLDPFYRIYFHDGTYLDYTGDSDKMKSQMAQFNIEDANNYDPFIEKTKRLYDAVITDGLGSTPFMDWSTMFNFLPQALKLNALMPAHSFVKGYFKDFRHRFAFSFHPLFIGGSPFRAPSVYLMIPYLEKVGGVWFTEGGMYSVVKAFERIFLELGGTVMTNSEVEKIMVKNGRAAGVLVNSQFYEADAVISNADFAHTHLDLINPDYRSKWSDKRVKNMDYSMSAFLLYIGVRKQYPELSHHTLILSQRYKELVKDIFDKKILPDDFSMYLHVPTRTDASMAPPGCESMYVLIPVANLQSKINWGKMARP